MAKEKTLEFVRTHSVPQFCKLVETDKVDIKKSPVNEGKYFMVDSVGNILGAVTPDLVDSHMKGEEVTPVISEVYPIELKGGKKEEIEEKTFFLLHRKGEGAETMFSLA